MTAYADVMEEDSAIVTVNQEKAYDRIEYDYLFKMLEHFNIPPMFIMMVKSLYATAFTRVTINRFLSTPF